MSLERENEMMKTYLITAQRIHDNEELQNRLEILLKVMLNVLDN